MFTLSNIQLTHNNLSIAGNTFLSLKCNPFCFSFSPLTQPNLSPYTHHSIFLQLIPPSLNSHPPLSNKSFFFAFYCQSLSIRPYQGPNLLLSLAFNHLSILPFTLYFSLFKHIPSLFTFTPILAPFLNIFNQGCTHP